MGDLGGFPKADINERTRFRPMVPASICFSSSLLVEQIRLSCDADLRTKGPLGACSPRAANLGS